jgi:PncC family amidohydrolase
VAAPAGPEAGAGLLTGPGSPTLEQLAERLQQLAVARGVTVGTAESCTGGLVGHAITSVPGSSAYYLGGVISYADRAKVELLGVTASTIDRHGAVSAQSAVAMAEGLRERLGCHLAVAVTGVAGPAGGTDAKPVGLTYVAVAEPAGHRVERHHWDGDRSTNQTLSAAAALSMLITTLDQDPLQAGR